MVSPARARPTGGAGSSGLMMPFMMPFDDLMPFAVYETQVQLLEAIISLAHWARGVGPLLALRCFPAVRAPSFAGVLGRFPPITCQYVPCTLTFSTSNFITLLALPAPRGVPLVHVCAMSASGCIRRTTCSALV